MAKSLSALLAQASIEDHDETLRAANAEIKKNKNDVDAQHAKAIALLHLDDFEGALKVFEDVKELQQKAQFEYAYTLYKTGDAAKAVQVAQGSDAKSDRKTQHILAQAVCVQTDHRSCRANARRHTGQRTSHRQPKCTRSSRVIPSNTRLSISTSTLAP
jgi:tetratricopeptide (TPR) repeat protein